MNQAAPATGKRPDPDWWARMTGVGTSVRRALLLPALAVLSALIIGAFIIAVTDIDTLKIWGSDPGEAFSRTVSGIGDAYRALFVGSLGSTKAITETLFAATPSILAGLLKARTGAHEVITTMMLNFVAVFLVDYLLKTSVFQQPGRDDPISKPAAASAQYPTLLDGYRVHIGILVALAAVGFAWWLMYRTTAGFQFRAVGFNPTGARYAGMNVAWLYVMVLAVSGALAGVAGANQILGLEPYRGLSNFAGSIGFDAIALALLGRSQPLGVLFAGLLFGALRAGGREMQGAAGIPIDLVLVLQALIIVMIAAPALVRAIYRIKTPEQEPTTVISTGWGG